MRQVQQILLDASEQNYWWLSSSQLICSLVLVGYGYVPRLAWERKDFLSRIYLISRHYLLLYAECHYDYATCIAYWWAIVSKSSVAYVTRFSSPMGKESFFKSHLFN